MIRREDIFQILQIVSLKEHFLFEKYDVLFIEFNNVRYNC